MPNEDPDQLHRDLRHLVDCHSTPGDEDEVARYLSESWGRSGWAVHCHGRYAISARLSQAAQAQPTILICAHMDSPGFTIDAVQDTRCRVIPLGQPRVKGPSSEVVLKTRALADGARESRRPSAAARVGDRTWVVMQKETSTNGSTAYWIPRHDDARRGDRLCFHGAAAISPEGSVRAPFLDNRFGCAVLCELARRWAASPPSVNVVLGATASEEIGSIGAPVLAAAVRPDLVVCIDATYEDPDQDVLMGQGPVLTLSDASVVLGCGQRDRALAFAERVGVPLQTEVYNVSGTDARSFPAVGLSAPVYALLLPTRQNHSPVEIGHLHDADSLVALLTAATEPNAWEGLFGTGFDLDEA